MLALGPDRVPALGRAERLGDGAEVGAGRVVRIDRAAARAAGQVDRVVPEDVEAGLRRALGRPQLLAIAEAQQLAEEDERPRPVAARLIAVWGQAPGDDLVAPIDLVGGREEGVQQAAVVRGSELPAVLVLRIES